MKCAWKDKMYENKVVDLYNKLGLLWTAYVESVVENAAADVFGVGRRKLAQMRSETAVDLNHYMVLYSSTDRDVRLTAMCGIPQLRRNSRCLGNST